MSFCHPSRCHTRAAADDGGSAGRGPFNRRPHSGSVRAMRIYLAGPDVFLPDPCARGAALKSVCARHGLTGVFPLDDVPGEPPEVAALPLARAIALRNELHIRSCDALIANLTPFRGPSADAGTVFELGFMRALGRPVFAWSNDPRPFTGRTRGFLGDAAVASPDGWRDGEGMLIEIVWPGRQSDDRRGGPGLRRRAVPRRRAGGRAVDGPQRLSALRRRHGRRLRVSRHGRRLESEASASAGASGPSAAATPNGPGSPPRGNSRVTCPILRPGRASVLP